MLPAQDLVALARHDNKNDEPPTQESIFNVLTRRHQLGLPYTRAGPSTLLVMNPNQPLNIYTEANGQLYIDHHAANNNNNNSNKPTSPTSATTTSLEPHVFELASTMYYHMRRTEQDQGVILRYISYITQQTTCPAPPLPSSSPFSFYVPVFALNGAPFVLCSLIR